VAAEYDNPTGTVPVAAMPQIQDFEQRLDTINATQLPATIASVLEGLRVRAAASGLATDPVTTPKKNRPVTAGSIVLERTCRGWDDSSTTPSPANGAIEVTAEYQASILQRTVWGTATTCHERVSGSNGASVHTFFDGTIAIFLEGPLASDPSQISFLMGWNGTIGTEGLQASSAFDFRVVPPQLEVRVPVADGSVIASVGGNGVLLRGANGTYGCSLVTFVCSLPQALRGAGTGP
jgi:hypothetical protein